MSEKKDESDNALADQHQTHRGYNEKTPAKPQGSFAPDSNDEEPTQKPTSNKSQVPDGKPGNDVE